MPSTYVLTFLMYYMPMILQKSRIELIVNISRVWGMLSLLLAKVLTSEDGDICPRGDICNGDIGTPACVSVTLSSWVRSLITDYVSGGWILLRRGLSPLPASGWC